MLMLKQVSRSLAAMALTPRTRSGSTYRPGAVARARRAAEFGTTRHGGEAAFTLTLGACSDRRAVVLSQPGAGRPTVGVYPVGDASESAGEFSGTIITGAATRPTGVFRATRGTVAITSITPERVIGTFELHATGYLTAAPEDRERSITVSGAFSATPGAAALALMAR
jgi:hypothetical protein